MEKLATINYLSLNYAYLEKERHLKMILLGCKEIDCVGCDEDDEEIIKLASQIFEFNHK